MNASPETNRVQFQHIHLSRRTPYHTANEADDNRNGERGMGEKGGRGRGGLLGGGWGGGCWGVVGGGLLGGGGGGGEGRGQFLCLNTGTYTNSTTQKLAPRTPSTAE